MNSMTGFGKAEVTTKECKITVEITSVNNRFLEVSTRLPRSFFSLEAKVKQLVNSNLDRGKISIWVGYEDSDDSPDKFLINWAALRAYHSQLVKFKKQMKLDGQIELSDLLSLPDVAKPERERIDEEATWKPLDQTLNKALKQLITMRRKEGQAMKADMTSRLKVLGSHLKEVVKLTSNSVEIYREKLRERISELVSPAEFNNGRLEEEIALFADKADISEECTRLASHIKQYQQVLKKSEPVGKRLNFILQEMNREANTIAAKSADFDLSSIAIGLKTDIEKLRELAQNVE